MTERMRPPARRTGGRTLGGARNTTPPPPPPAAELTPEQYAAERTAAQTTARADEITLPADSTVAPMPVVEATVATDVAPETGAPPVAADSAPANLPAAAARESAKGEPVEEAGAASQRNPVTTGQAVTPTPQTTGESEPHAVQVTSPAPDTSTAAATASEVAVRPATAPVAVAGGTVFPIPGSEPAPGHDRGARSGEAPSEGPPWAPGPGRPGNIPDVAVLLNQRVITRESLDSSVPAALKLKRRIKRFALENELDHLPLGDIVAVAMDEWLTTRGF